MVLIADYVSASDIRLPGGISICKEGSPHQGDLVLLCAWGSPFDCTKNFRREQGALEYVVPLV